MTSWENWPREIRRLILSKVQLNRRTRTLCPAVCREWQQFFETINFRKVVIRPADVGYSEQVCRHHRAALVKHIWLRLDLESHCVHCQPAEASREHAQNCKVFTDGVQDLLRVLATWETEVAGGLTLEISADSMGIETGDPSCWAFRFQERIYPCLEGKSCTDESHASHAEAEKAVQRSRNSRPTTCSSDLSRVTRGTERVIRVLGSPLKLFIPMSVVINHFRLASEIPEVDVVKRLLIRRQFCRPFDLTSLGVILTKLPRLESLEHEPWKPFASLRRSTADSYETFLERQLPKSVKRFSFYEQTDPHSPKYHPNDCKEIGAHLADYAVNMEHLAVSFLADASHFFQDFFPETPGRYSPPAMTFICESLSETQMAALELLMISSPEEGRRERIERHIAEECRLRYQPKWPSMIALALTSSLLVPSTCSSRINDMLHSVAQAALNMPQLQTMEIWNAGEGSACVFRYQAVDMRAMVTLLSTWAVDLPRRVVEAWEKVARKRFDDFCPLLVSVERLPKEEVFETRHSLIGHLELKGLIVQPVSLCQVRYDTELYKDDDD